MPFFAIDCEATIIFKLTVTQGLAKHLTYHQTVMNQEANESISLTVLPMENILFQCHCAHCNWELFGFAMPSSNVV